MKKIILFLVLCTRLIFSTSVHAFEIPSEPMGYVHDQAQILTTEQRELLDQKLRDFDQKTTTQIVVAIFSSLEGESLEDTSLKIATQWKIGQKDKDNGVLLSVFIEDHKVRIEVGYGLEGVIPDALASRIIEEKIKPNFRDQNYFVGLVEATEGLMQASRGEYPEEPKIDEYKTKLLSIGIFSVILLYILWWMFFDLGRIFKAIFKAIFFFPSLLIPSYRRAAAQSLREWGQKNGQVFSKLKNDISAHGVKGGFDKFSKDYEAVHGKSSSSDDNNSSDSGFSGGGGSFGGGGSSGGW